MFHLNLQQMLLKLYMITCCSQELFSAYPFILKTKHDTVSMLHSMEEDPSRSCFLWSCSPPGLRGLMKSDPSFIKIQGWGLVIKKKKKGEEEGKKQALVNYITPPERREIQSSGPMGGKRGTG